MAAARSSSVVASAADRYASSGVFTSTTSCRPSGMLTIMSGRRLPSSPGTCTCSTKSQCSTMPASSARRFSVISPHWPRTSGRRNAVTRLRVSRCSATWPSVTPSSEFLSAPNVSARSFSMRAICSCVFCNASRTGASMVSTDFSRSVRLRNATSCCCPSVCRASCRNASLLPRSASPATVSKPERSFCMASSSAWSRSRTISSADFSSARVVAISISRACVRRRPISQPMASATTGSRTSRITASVESVFTCGPRQCPSTPAVAPGDR